MIAVAPLRLGLISFAWTRHNNGGLRSHVIDIANKLATMDVQVFVHCVNSNPSAPPFETCSWKEGTIHIQQMNYAYQNVSSMLDFQRVPQAEIVLTEWVQRLKLDVVDIHHCLYIGLRTIKKLAKHVPVISTLHDYWALDPRGQLFYNNHNHKIISPKAWEEGANLTWPHFVNKSKEALSYYAGSPKMSKESETSLKNAWIKYSRDCLSESHLLITPSNASALTFLRNGINQTIQIVENGIDTSALYNGIKSEKCSNPELNRSEILHLTILGNIIPSKGQLAFCRACLTPSLIDRVKINLHGSFPDTYHGEIRPQSELRELCKLHPNHLTAHGPYERSELSTIFANSDLVVMPSLWEEVYGLVAREALCYGLPLIISDAGGLSDLANRSHVFCLDHTNPLGWSKTLLNGIENGPLYKWVYERRQGIPPQDNQVRSSDECTAELKQIYLKVLDSRA